MSGCFTKALVTNICRVLGLTILTLAPAALFAQGRSPHSAFEEVRRFSAEEAFQGVAVDGNHFYAISNRRIGKYEKHSGLRVGQWEGDPDGPIIHLDSRIVREGRLYCAHSNFPGVPTVSSIEVFDTDTMDHVGSHSFGIFAGSATWVDWADGYWWVAFGHYAGLGGVPDRGQDWTNVVQFDDGWRRLAGYVYPRDVVDRFETMSNSGGSWGADGLLYATGHDEAEVFVLSLPTAGSVLEVRETLPVTAEGQGIAWDRDEPGTFYSIIRSSREVVVSKLQQ